MERMRNIRPAGLSTALVALALVVLAGTCDNPVNLTQALEVEVMKANDRYLEVVRTTPVDGENEANPGSRIRAVLDRDVDIDSVTPGTISIVQHIDPDTTVTAAWTATFDPVTKTLAIKPTTILADSADYSVTLSGLRGVDGSTLLEDVVWQFHTIVAPAGQVIVTSTNTDSLAGYTNTTSVNVSISSPNVLATDYTVASTESALDNPDGNGGSWTWAAIGAITAHTIPAVQGAQYTYVMIRDITGPQYSAVLDTGIIYDTVAPSAPTVTGTSPTTSRRPTWSWSKGAGDGNGTFQYQLDSTAGAWTTTTATSYTPGGDLALGSHVLYVRERDNAGNWSPNGSKTIGIVPLAPTGVGASDGTSTAQVAVSWTAPAGVIVKYYIDRATSATGTYSNVGSVNAPTVSYNDTGATPGILYYYKVRAEGTDGYISALSAYDAGYRKLSTPAGVSASDDSSTSYVTITWGSVAGAATYYVDRSTDNVTFSNLGTIGTLSYNDAAASPGAVYYYRIRAYANGYYSDASASDSGVRKLATPSILASDGESSTGVVLTWGSVTGAANYYVYRATTYNGIYNLVASAVAGTTWTDTAPAVSTTYYYAVRAQANGYYSDYSPYNAGYKGLAAVTGLSARTYMTYNYIQLSWTALAGADGYMIYQYNSSTYTWDYYANTTGAVANLAPSVYNTPLYYKVRAYSVSTGFPGEWTPTYVGGRRLGLNGYWQFNNSWNDSGYVDSSYDNFSIASGAPSFSTTRAVGSYSAYFNTYGEKITSSDYSFMSTDRKLVSVSYWVYPTKLSTGLMWAMACSDFNVGFSGTQVTMTISTPSTNSASATLTLNAWNHIVGTYDGSYIRIYKNGALVQSTAHAGTVSGGWTYLYVNSGTSSNYWTGYIDDLRIYDVTLTGSQVLDLYNLD